MVSTTTYVAYNIQMIPSLLPLEVGQVVKFISPLNDDEREERFIVRELRGERVLVEYVCDMRIRPTSVYLTADLTSVDA